MAYEWASEPFQRKPWGVRLEDTIADSFYTTRDGSSGEGLLGEIPKPGAVRYEDSIRGSGQYKNVRAHGECWFRWGCNRSGTAFTVGQIARKSANLLVTADAAGTTTTMEDGSAFVADEEVGNILYILDNADAAGAAPEGEWGIVVKNTADVLTIQPALTVATASSDTGTLVRVGHLGLLGGAIEREETFGITMATTVGDNVWGWFGCKGLLESATVAAGVVIAQGEGLIGVAGGLLTTGVATSGQDIMLARAITAHTTDTVRRFLICYFDVLFGLPFTGVTQKQ